MSALDRLKQIQSNFKRQWNGVDCAVSGRVGTSNFVNKKRTFIIPESFVEEEERQRTIGKIFNKLRDFEEDPHRPSTTTSAGVSQSASSTGASFNKTAAATTTAGTGNGANAGFFNAPGTAQATGGFAKNRENEYISFKNVKEN